jgi:2,6-dihydroxypseudooxynicotine hydrolase
MARDPQVDLVFAHNLARYIATGIDPNDAQRLIACIDRWENWCRLWSEEAACHEALAKEATHNCRTLTAAEAYVRAAIYYHYAKHLFASHVDEWRAAHDSVVRCYAAGAPGLDPPLERLTFPYLGVDIPAWLRKPRGCRRPPVAILLPGLDACKEELHAWAAAFVARGVAALTIDGPGQGETSFHLPTTHEWGRVVGAVIDALEGRDDLDARRIGAVGQSLGAIYAPLAAAGEPRIKACIANCGPYDAGRLLPKLPPLHQEVFRQGAHARTAEEAQWVANKITLVGAAERITCPLLVVVGGDDKLVPPSEGERLAKTASGPTELVVYPEGNHVCFNISYKFRPLTADWMAERLGAQLAGSGARSGNHSDDVIIERHAEVIEASLEGRAPIVRGSAFLCASTSG